MPAFSRRDLLRTALFGAGHVGLRALATGLPVWFLAAPRRASAADMECALSAKDRAQFLIVSSSSAGDALSCNCPGTYGSSAIIHPQQAEMAATDFMLGSSSVRAAKPWSALGEGVRARTHFFHHMTGGIVHGDHPKVMRFLGRSTGGEMWPSIYAKHLYACLGTVQAEPVSVGTRGNQLELVAYSGRSLPAIAPTQLKQLLTGSKDDPLVQLRGLRDQTLDSLNAVFKENAMPSQARFLDAMASSQRQVRQLAEGLATTLQAIDGDDVRGQALAAAALVAAKVTPVVTLHIPFGGDNHDDPDLEDEWFDTTDHDDSGRGVAGIQAVMDALAALGLSDGATFATMNVFGRDLSGSAKVSARAGRDHFGKHSVMVMIGKNVAPGISGGAVALSDNVYGASDIDSASGAAHKGADIASADSHVAAAKTLGRALGIDAAALDADFTDRGKVKSVASALSG